MKSVYYHYPRLSSDYEYQIFLKNRLNYLTEELTEAMEQAAGKYIIEWLQAQIALHINLLGKQLIK